MKYEVIRFFTDAQDNEFAYNVGDPFPRVGKSVSEERIDELSGTSNKQGRPLIKAVDEPEPEPEVTEDADEPKYSKNDIMRMSTAGLKELGEELGIEDAANKTGGALKPLIIERLGL